MTSVEYLGRLRPHLQGALRSLVDGRPKDAGLAVSDYLGSSRGTMPVGEQGSAAAGGGGGVYEQTAGTPRAGGGVGEEDEEVVE